MEAVKKHISSIRDLDKEAQIVAFLESGDYTLQQVAIIFALSRERIRQLYLRSTGHHSTQWRTKNKIIKREAYLNQFRYNCLGCGEAVTHKTRMGGFKYCKKCAKIAVGKKRNIQVLKVCDFCKKLYPPLLNRHSPSQINKRGLYFCSGKCYRASSSFHINLKKVINCQDCKIEVLATGTRQAFCEKCAKLRIKNYKHLKYLRDKQAFYQ